MTLGSRRDEETVVILLLVLETIVDASGSTWSSERPLSVNPLSICLITPLLLIGTWSFSAAETSVYDITRGSAATQRLVWTTGLDVSTGFVLRKCCWDECCDLFGCLDSRATVH